MKTKDKFVNHFVHGDQEDNIFIKYQKEGVIDSLFYLSFVSYIIIYYNIILNNMLYHTVLKNKRTIKSDWLQEDILNLTDPTFVIPESYQYDILEVTEKYVARPDILSKDIYGDTLYSDLLCKLNGISNPFELNKNMLLIIPSPDCIMDFMKTPTTNECDSSITNEINKPIAKQKNQKRKANEAVIGDARFNIDKTRGVVIY